MNFQQGTLRKAFLARLAANLRKQPRPWECMPGRASRRVSWCVWQPTFGLCLRKRNFKNELPAGHPQE